MSSLPKLPRTSSSNERPDKSRDLKIHKSAIANRRSRNADQLKPEIVPSKSEIQHQKTDKPRYIMIGGFLGAGKTTAVAKLAERLSQQGRRVGLITNDQGSELVDTAMLRSRGFATEEIPGGCFCCRFNSLVDAANRLTATTRPDVFIAEPVGSCTDLVATVTYPLRRIYGQDFLIAPLSVLVDPIRALRIFGIENGGKFSEKVIYIYRKQLEEADLIVVNKCDRLDVPRRKILRGELESRFAHAEILEVSARTGLGLDRWLNRILGMEQTARTPMEVDYDVYAQGEALLGWLNCTIQISATEGFDANDVLKKLAEKLQSLLREQGAEVAHLKMTFTPDTGLGDLAVVNLVRNDFVPELSQTLEEPCDRGQLIVNLRAEAPPELLRDAVERAVGTVAKSFASVTARIEHLEHFCPGRPQPTHRDTSPF